MLSASDGLTRLKKWSWRGKIESKLLIRTRWRTAVMRMKRIWNSEK